MTLKQLCGAQKKYNLFAESGTESGTGAVMGTGVGTGPGAGTGAGTRAGTGADMGTVRALEAGEGTKRVTENENSKTFSY